MKTLKLFLCFAVAMIAFAACSNKEEAAKVAEKVESGATLDQGDYAVIVKYLGDFAEKAQPIQDQINNLPYGDPKAEEYSAQLNDLKKANPLVDLFSGVLKRSTATEVGADNVAAVDKLAGYEWFDAPAWATSNMDPAIGGIELESPSTDTDGVVAGAVDQLKVKE